MMLSNSFLAFLASSLFISSVSATPLISPKVDSAASTLSAAENQAISFGTYTDRGCSGGQQDYLKADGSCHGLPGQGMEVWWFADTCRAFIYKGADCSAASGEVQVHIGQCYDTAQYVRIKVFCH